MVFASSLLPSALRRPEKTETPKLLLSRADAAAALGVSERMLDTLTAPHGPLKPVRVGRRVLFSPAMLQRWIDAESSEAVASNSASNITEQSS